MKSRTFAKILQVDPDEKWPTLDTFWASIILYWFSLKDSLFRNQLIFYQKGYQPSDELFHKQMICYQLQITCVLVSVFRTTSVSVLVRLKWWIYTLFYYKRYYIKKDIQKMAEDMYCYTQEYSSTCYTLLKMKKAFINKISLIS